MIPFRIARYAEQLLNSVIHQVESCNLKPEFFDTRASRAQSTRPQSSLYLASTPTKKSRFDETVLNGEGYRYFAAVEHEKTQRYPNQIIHKENHENQIYNVVSIVLSAERGAAAFLQERITKFFSPEAIHTLLAFLRFYADYREKDISRFPCHEKLPEIVQKNLEELPSIEDFSAERDALLDNLNIPVLDEPAATTSGAPMEIDQDFDNDFDFHDAPTDFDDVPSSTQQPLSAKESQDIFAHYDDDNE
uniref:Uncharacterized protein n=1 Tax=Panagrolaimus superbus TaxID=310955 RepID=A0A914Y9Q5_9BILA